MASMTIPTKFVFLIVISVVPSVHAWQNGYDQNHQRQCPNGQSIKEITSMHHNGAEDRRFDVRCQSTGANQGCFWTNYINNWDQPILYLCPDNKVLSGISSYHNNRAEDRRYKFYCCGAAGKYPKNCHLTDFVNSWDEYFSFRVGGNQVITGVYSIHHNGAEDRRFRFIRCDF